MEPKFWMVLITGLIPLIIGSAWYSPALFGNAWMKASGTSEEKARSGNMLVIFGCVYLFGVMISLMMAQIAIHQNAIYGLFATAPEFKDVSSEISITFNELMTNYGDRHRSFGHGVVHGAFTTVLLIFPIIATVSLFERRGWKYIFLHSGYWLITLMLIGGVLCHFM